jgi:hypothetical protein
MSRNLLILAMLVAGCGEPAPALVSRQTDNQHFKVDKLFTQDGCTVYRFTDGGYRRYFARCEAATSSVQWSENCGKNCTRPGEVPTGVLQ